LAHELVPLAQPSKGLETVKRCRLDLWHNGIHPMGERGRELLGLEIVFASAKLRGLYTSRAALTKEFGAQAAKAISRRLDDARAAVSLQDLRNTPGRWHELSGDRAGQIAASVTSNLRIVFEIANDPIPRRASDSGLDWSRVTAIRLIEVVDYHG
jgi:toxin HigB-1